MFLIRSSSLPCSQQSCCSWIRSTIAPIRHLNLWCSRRVVPSYINRYPIPISEMLVHHPWRWVAPNKIHPGYHISLCLLAMMCFWSDSILFLDVSVAAPLPGCLFSSRSQCDGSLYVSDMEQMRAEELCRPEGGSRWWEASRYLLSNVLTLSSCRADALLYTKKIVLIIFIKQSCFSIHF